MEIINDQNTYKLSSGISTIKGGIKVLEELKYNQTIIDGAKSIINQLSI